MGLRRSTENSAAAQTTGGKALASFARDGHFDVTRCARLPTNFCFEKIRETHRKHLYFRAFRHVARSAVYFRAFWRRWNSLAIIPAETPCFKAYFWPPPENAGKTRAPGGGRMSARSPARFAQKLLLTTPFSPLLSTNHYPLSTSSHH